MGDHRQGRMSLQAELPSSKAKREQALRNILAARRRQILSQRALETSRGAGARTPKPKDSSLKDSSDVLEAQETRHGLYVTATSRTESPVEDETSESSSRIFDKPSSESTSEDPKIEAAASSSEDKRTIEETSPESSNEDTSLASIESAAASGNSRGDYSNANGSSTVESSPFPSTSSSPVSSGQKSTDAEGRKRNTVAMPESLYNYFRPVESNIPVEDMSQFLYFGQKLQPEVHNTTGNNSVEVTPTAPTAPSSRRRYSAKRYSSTTAVPLPKLEEIMNEEMNIAVERQTVEKNKVSKIKNTFRSPENALYYKKSRPTEPTIASNVILTKESGGNGTVEGTTGADDKFDSENPSAHAATQEQLQRASERGSVPAHVPPETRNATDSTQIPRQQLVSANVRGTDERGSVESEIRFENRPTEPPRDSLVLLNGVDSTKGTYSRRRKTDNSTTILDVHSEELLTPVDVEETDPREDTIAEDTSNVREVQTYADRPEQSSFMTSTYVDTSDRLEHHPESQPNPPLGPHPSNVRESNNIETSTSRNKVSRSTTEPSYPVPWSATSEQPSTSTLRIIVTEGSYDAIESDAGDKNTVKPAASTEERVHAVASSGIPAAPATTLAPLAANSPEPRRALEMAPSSADARQHPRAQQQQQQHVYAYTITNVTRLLRNYTGPGLSKEYRGGAGGGVDQVRSSGTAEITTGSPQQSAQRSPPSSPLLLPRAGSSIEAVRAPAELSAGTTVEPAVAGEPSRGAGVGERPRKVVAVAQQWQQRALVRSTSSYSQQAVNKSGARLASKAEVVTGRGAIRWSYPKRNNFDQEGAGDRRFLRKSASAVLNQRVGAAGVEDEAPSVTVIGKRRRLTSGVSAVLGRRAKGANSTTEDTIGSNARLMGVNGSAVNRERKNFGKVGKVGKDDAVEGRALGVTMHLGTANQRFDPEIRTAEAAMEEAKDLSVVSNATESVIGGTPSVAADGSTVNEYRDSSAGTIGPPSGDPDSDARDRGDATARSESESGAGEVASATSSTGTVSADKSGDNGSGSPAVTVTEGLDGTTVPKESAPGTATPPTPVFPVTPRIIAEVGRVPVQKETFTSGPAESVNREADSKTAESGAPANLDPSEIQKLYRSRNFTTTEEPMPTTTQVDSQDTLPPQNREASTEATIVPDPTTSSPTVDTRRNMTAERSPDVRARNLSDKSKDKDDVLPIMQLYNTSDIFNGSGPMDSFARGAERPRVELPIDAAPPSATEKVEAVVPAKSLSASSVPVPHSKEATGAQAVPRKEKHDGNRDAASQPPPTGPGRGHGFVNGSSNGGHGNRTRHRPVYHQPILPEYNGSVYDNELNRTFFDAGLIAVSPRESVNISEVISRRHDGDALASQETIAVVSYILATLVVFPIAVGVGLILRRLILRNRKVLEESDTSSEISCRKDALNLENGDFKTSIEKAITKLPRIQHLCHEAEKPPPPPSQESRWEFPRDKLRLQTVLGQGNFGQVWKAEADDLTGHQGTTRLVAVKTVKEGASDREKEDLVRELEIMQQLGSHPNVVTLLGCCTEEEPHYLILEYVMYGKLLAYLRDHRTRQDFYNFSEDSAALTSRDLTVFGYCVARGMEYLASKKIIHRDLAARNVLVDHNKLCKIADFGMSRFANEDGEVIETRHGRNALPIRWMAPESLIYSLFTTKTDVWSFGILMWEIVTLGSTPYPDMTAREVMRNVQNGYRLERPSHCRSELFRLISRCWHADPDRRPEFQTLRRDLAQLLEDNMNGHYVDLESFASECTD